MQRAAAISPAPRGSAPVLHAWLSAALFGTAALTGCAPGQPPVVTGAACVVSAPAGADRVVLVSEAQAAVDAGQPWRTTFHIDARSTTPVSLELTAVGCSCYAVQQAGRPLHVGDRLSVPAGGRIEVSIAASPPSKPGVMQYRADFSGRNADGTDFTLSLASSVHTIADLLVQPDVVHIALGRGETRPHDAIDMQVEQHVRSESAQGLLVAWNALPDDVAVTPPKLTEPPVEVSPGLWRARWRSKLRVARTELLDLETPRGLAVDSLVDGQRRARTNCMLMVRRESGVRAPRLVHFGRLPAHAGATRRIQLRALDGRAFRITAAESRDGLVRASGAAAAASAEHWLEVQVEPVKCGIDDVLTIQTDHPESPELRIVVRALSSQASGMTQSETQAASR